MDIDDILKELLQERKYIDDAIRTLQRLEHARGQRSGRAPSRLPDTPALKPSKPPTAPKCPKG